MASHARRTTRIEIPLPLKPRDYKLGDGPELVPLRLTLENDTNAFIVDKRVVPGRACNGDLKLEMYYIVGWPDLPAARVAILATQIHDYVSPRTLEDYEYECLLEQDLQDERRRAEEKKKADELYRMRLLSAPRPSTPASSTDPSQKKRGRPSKADLQARKLAKQASFGKDELANVPLPPASTSGPSLSTPQKKLPMGIAIGANDLDEADGEGPQSKEAVARQLFGHSSGGSSSRSQSSDSGGESGEPSNSLMPGPGASFRGYAQSVFSYLPSIFGRRESPQPKSPTPISLRTTSPKHKMSSRPESKLTRSVPVSNSEPLTHHKITPIPAPVYGHKSLQRPQEPRQVTVTGMPVPPYAVSRRASPNKPHEKTFTPVPVPSHPLQRPRSPPKPHKVTVTPVPPPVLPTFPQQGNSFTPAGRSAGKWPVGDSHTLNTPSAAPPAKKSKRERSEEAEDGWEVERLEGDQTVKINGRWVRQFRVRWAGNWPPDQKHTWEPEENISEPLIRTYMKRKARNFGQSPASKSSKLPTFQFPKRKYSSVAEAFAGNAEDSPSSGSVFEDTSTEEETEEGEEHLHVTEQRSRTNSPIKNPRVDPALVRELAARFGSSGSFDVSP